MARCNAHLLQNLGTGGRVFPKGEIHSRWVCRSMLTHNIKASSHRSACLCISSTHPPLPLTTAHCVLQVLPEGERPEEYFTKFQITTGKCTNPITTRNTTLGMHVNTRDGLKVKLTKKEEHNWDKFWITGLALPKKAVVDEVVEGRSDS